MTTSIATSGLPPFYADPRRACRNKDPDLWFPPAGRAWAVPVAKKVCWTCPIKDECREWAVPITDLFGIWGGTTPAERKRLRNERADGG